MPQQDWPDMIRTLRLRRGYSQAMLADRLGVDQTAVSRWERGLDEPRVTIRRRLLDFYRLSSAVRQDEIVRARTRNALWPVSLVGPGSVFLEISRPALAEVGLPVEDVRSRPIYGLFGPEVDEVTERWEATGIFHGDIAMTMSLNTIGPRENPHYVRTLDTPHFTSDGDVWCLCEIQRITRDVYEGLKTTYGSTTFEIPFDQISEPF